MDSAFTHVHKFERIRMPVLVLFTCVQSRLRMRCNNFEMQRKVGYFNIRTQKPLPESVEQMFDSSPRRLPQS